MYGPGVNKSVPTLDRSGFNSDYLRLILEMATNEYFYWIANLGVVNFSLYQPNKENDRYAIFNPERLRSTINPFRLETSYVTKNTFQVTKCFAMSSGTNVLEVHFHVKNGLLHPDHVSVMRASISRNLKMQFPQYIKNIFSPDKYDSRIRFYLTDSLYDDIDKRNSAISEMIVYFETQRTKLFQDSFIATPHVINDVSKNIDEVYMYEMLIMHKYKQMYRILVFTSTKINLKSLVTYVIILFYIGWLIAFRRLIFARVSD